MSIRKSAEMKSNKSKMVLPRTFQLLSGPMDKEQRQPSIQTKRKTTNTATLRFILNSSMQKATITSSMEMEEVRAASSSATKKKMAITPPSGIWLKICGSVTNTRSGPSPGLMPKANTAGMMAQPAMMAKSVSAMAVWELNEMILASFFT